MTRIAIWTILFFSFSASAVAQSREDSLKKIIAQERSDIGEADAMAMLAHISSSPDTNEYYAKKGLLLSRNLGYKRGEADCLMALGNFESDHSNFGDAIQYNLDAIAILETINDQSRLSSAYLPLQGNYSIIGDYNTSLKYAFAGEKLAKENNLKGVYYFAGHHLSTLFLAEIAQTYVLKGLIDSAQFYTRKCIDQNELFNGTAWNFPIYLLATIQTMQGDYKAAIANYRKAAELAPKNGFERDTLQVFSGMSTLFLKNGALDSTIRYAKIVAQHWTTDSEIKNLLEALQNLAATYKIQHRYDSALKYSELAHQTNDSLLSKDKDRQVQNISFKEQIKQNQILAEQARYKNRVQTYAMAAGVLGLILITGILWRNFRQQRKAKNDIEKAYYELSTTQEQLVQSKKMASLGELTAGIAHEIQNPLNFVNNFSELNAELVDDLQDELKNGNIKEALTIANDIRENEIKIAQHGERAGAIVKNMMQHSGFTNAQKESTDINLLLNESLELSYQAFRVKEKMFSAEIIKDLDPSIEKLNVVPAEIGRVFQNIFNNAWYALLEKQLSTGTEFQPRVWISSKKSGNAVQVVIRNNGEGIPQHILDKIFQPFFTTKPTGIGTGLGLSLSYDIITRGHRGAIRVDSNDHTYTSFIIELPAIT